MLALAKLLVKLAWANTSRASIYISIPISMAMPVNGYNEYPS